MTSVFRSAIIFSDEAQVFLQAFPLVYPFCDLGPRVQITHLPLFDVFACRDSHVSSLPTYVFGLSAHPRVGNSCAVLPYLHVDWDAVIPPQDLLHWLQSFSVRGPLDSPA
jgi:hypothetical protein